ncbi:hypothetical protein CUJ86_07680 [Methanofollis fontis]|uniref:Uncharacterized protein n=2 Tax=Methanofollis fontis TaxID=2052832 RepID=A0A483CP93_9EURY|nr:hypothetical protein CUJ86_07680 [Methanofollis fontis]
MSVGHAVAILPDSAYFDEPATLRFALPPELRSSSALVFIADYTDEVWGILPSRIEEGMVCADISGAGVFCPMQFASSETATTITTVPATTPATTEPPTTPQQTPLGCAVLLSIFAVMFLLRRAGK